MESSTLPQCAGDMVKHDIPDEGRGKPPVLSQLENPGGGSLEGIVNPGGAKL